MEDGRQKTDNRRRKTEDRTLRSEAPMRTTRRRALFSVLCLLPSLFFVLAACGKKGPPLAPLNMAPEAPQTITARRLGGTVYLQMTVPAKSTLGKGPFSDDHLEVYAVTLAPGAILPANRDLLKPEHVIAKIEIQPPADPDAPPRSASRRTRSPYRDAGACPAWPAAARPDRPAAGSRFSR